MNRNRWNAIALGSCALAIAWAQTASVDRWLPPGGGGADNMSLYRNLRAVDGLYREYMRADSLLPLLPATPRIHAMLSPLLTDNAAGRISARLERETAEIDNPRARVGVFVVDARLGQRPGTVIGSSDAREIHVGTDSAGAYCAMVFAQYVIRDTIMNPSFDQRIDRRPYSSVLGPCFFVAKYGAPGPGTARWLSGGGYRFAMLTGSAAAGFEPERYSDWWYQHAEEGRLLRGCRGGRIEQCGAIMSLVTRTSTDGPAAYQFERVYRVETGATRTLLHDLEQQFGPDRFARFWTSDQDMPAAFSAAFDTDVGTWVHEWTGRYWDPVILGARIDGASILMSVLCVLAFGVAATIVVVRRQV